MIYLLIFRTEKKMKNFLKISIILATALNSQFLHAHKDHKKRPAMPAIGVLQGSIKDSTSMKPLNMPQFP